MQKIRKQHYVPEVYLRSWETTVKTDETHRQNRIYVFKNQFDEGVAKSVDKVLWKSNIYTVDFKDNFIIEKCPEIKSDFVNQIYGLMRESDNKVYGKKGYSIIKTKGSIYKHLTEIYDWTFYNDDGSKASDKKIMNQISDFKSVVLETEFNRVFETNWKRILNEFIYEVKYSDFYHDKSNKHGISINTAADMLNFFFMMVCRNPDFDAMGIYTQMKENVLYPAFKYIFNSGSGGDNEEGTRYADEMMRGVWYSELYRLLLKKTSVGFYHSIVEKALINLQPILFETYKGAGSFITSDKPAFRHISYVEAQNHNGYIFPLTPEYLLFLAKGNEGINVVDYRMADSKTISYFNNVIMAHKKELVISNHKQMNY